MFPHSTGVQTPFTYVLCLVMRAPWSVYVISVIIVVSYKCVFVCVTDPKMTKLMPKQNTQNDKETRS